MTQFDFKKTWQSLSKDVKLAIANDAGTTYQYIRLGLVYRNKKPRPNFIKRLCKSMNKNGVPVTETEMMGWFYELA
ncbi:hypothetical protein [Pectobacterium versatile]|uniref:hypothetical protein n=1 Tax=Pectobacterium versatile TaxID=2488639 RepID=UPI00102E2979|nr:hypothetical protein [Pectobacterium versatile]TAI99828.1 hypothetical protein EG332_04275 [Pectobacterium versatile]UEQ10481.1 hypothetical protein LLE50_05050 [Pectobacterium versatile]GKX40308.1 hypothetical protein SOASR014_40470 [Pectobacterium carotovorum subsp. carotovorum]GLX46419.1 hypothetical protein Pcaca01_40870 [Pectobacterium carotovorum subsp. carotovorum]